MDGQAVFKLAVGVLEQAAKAVLAKAGKTEADIDWLIPHQANIRIMQGTARKLKLPMDKLVVTVHEHGNTSAASLLLARLTGLDIADATGAGTGLDAEAVQRKIGILRQVLARHPDARSPLDALAAFGGFEVATMVGAVLQAQAQVERALQRDLAGIDLVVGEEWEYQKPCAEFWIGVANGRGISIGIHKNSAMLKHSYAYGFESEPKSLVMLSELHKRLAWLRAERQKRVIEIANLDGAMQDSEMWLELATLRSRNATVAYEPPPK
jgi:hypothetical protein